MKLALALAVAASAQARLNEPSAAHATWAESFGKSYPRTEERAYRRGIKKFYPLRQVGRPRLPDCEKRALFLAASLRSSISPGVLPSTAKC